MKCRAFRSRVDRQAMSRERSGRQAIARGIRGAHAGRGSEFEGHPVEERAVTGQIFLRPTLQAGSSLCWAITKEGTKGGGEGAVILEAPTSSAS